MRRMMNPVKHKGGINTRTSRHYIEPSFSMESGIRESEQHREVLSVKEVAEYLGVSESIIRRLVRDRNIPFNRIEGRILFYLPAVRNWLMFHSVQPSGDSNSSEDGHAEIKADKFWNIGKGA